MTARGPKVAPTGLRVITQYWKGSVRVCELECAGVMLDVHISRKAVSVPDGWLIEVRNNHTEAAVMISGEGATAAAALLAAGNARSAEGPALGLGSFDWVDVGEALRAVHALD